MVKKESGITTWMGTIRLAMLNDPGRQLLEDRVHSQGFLFLDEYLDDIKSSSKQESAIVDLVKTPGRRRDAPKKTRSALAAAARAQTAINFSLEDDGGKENHGPVNRFHEALLQAKHSAEQQEATRPPLSPKQYTSNLATLPGKTRSVKIADADYDYIDVSSSPEPSPARALAPTEQEPELRPLPAPSFNSQAGNMKELSIIAEDDEPISSMPASSSKRSLRLSPPSAAAFPRKFEPVEEEDAPPISVMDVDDDRKTIKSRSPSPHYPRSVITVRPDDPADLPQASSSKTFVDVKVPLRDADDESAPVFARKQSMPRFQLPSLGQPSPLRKSAAGTLLSLNAATTITTAAAPAPAPPGAGKRTSWLVKAREARAAKVAEDGTKISGPSNSKASSGDLKRKSDDIAGNVGTTGLEEAPLDAERKIKVTKTYHDLAAEAMEIDAPIRSAGTLPQDDLRDITANHTANQSSHSGLGQLKKTVEGMGAKGAKSSGKSLEGAAVELAKIRAAAEARVAAQKDVDAPAEHRSSQSPPSEPGLTLPTTKTQRPPSPVEMPPPPPPLRQDNDKRLSISDLVVKTNKPSAQQTTVKEVDVSSSTTPPGSPKQSTRVHPTVFNKPPPDLVRPPVPAADRQTERSGLLGEFSFKLPTSSYSLRPPLGLGLQAFSKPSSQADSEPSSQSTVFSDNVFDSQRYGTSSSIYTSQESQYKDVPPEGPELLTQAATNDDDDTWGLDEKLAATNQQWTPYAADTAAFDTTDTWDKKNAFGFPYVNSQSSTETWNSTRSSALRAGDTGAFTGSILEAEPEDEPVPNVRPDVDGEYVEQAEDLGAPPPAADKGKGKDADMQSIRSQSQMSMLSSSDESQPSGFIGHATKFVSDIFGVSTGSAKKDKGQLKSLKLAAAVARKQKEEQDKKDARLKEMEARRQAAIQRKAEETRQQAEEEERRVRDEAERRKKEREELTGKRTLKPVHEKKASDDELKKKKVFVEMPKPSFKDKKPAPGPSKLARPSPAVKPRPLTKQASTTTLTDKTTKSVPASAKGKGKAIASNDSDVEGKSGPATRSARAKVDTGPSKLEPAVQQEWIDLPEPKSEYSDSGDEDRKKDYEVAAWARSPSLMAQLSQQQAIDPDDIFGPIQPLRMEEMFRTRQSRFRARTSSANWSGPDGLSEQEAREYARRMGFR